MSEFCESCKFACPWPGEFGVLLCSLKCEERCAFEKACSYWTGMEKKGERKWKHRAKLERDAR